MDDKHDSSGSQIAFTGPAPHRASTRMGSANYCSRKIRTLPAIEPIIPAPLKLVVLTTSLLNYFEGLYLLPYPPKPIFYEKVNTFCAIRVYIKGNQTAAIGKKYISNKL